MSDASAHAEAARVAILNAQRELRCWGMDPTGTYTPTIRQGASEAVSYLQEVERRVRLALDALLVEVITADAESGERVAREGQGALEPSP
jgi:uncharacterized protein YqiB (DUF1249 family)